jgi:PAS domain S-box-containing protein
MNPSLAQIPRHLGLVAAYAALATLALQLFAANGVVSVIWLPSGLALGALILGGRKYLPAIWLGAWFANLLATGSPFVAAGIACGNTLEAFVAHWLILRSRDFDPGLRELRNFLRLLVLGALAATIIAALVGPTILMLAGSIDAAAWLANFVRWWMGDALGIALITPLILFWRRPPAWRKEKRIGEAAWLFGIGLLVGQITFLDQFNLFQHFGPVARGYWMFLLLTWAAVRLGPHGVTLLLLMAGTQALTGAWLEVGPFARDLKETHLSSYWGYMMVLAVVGMTLAIYIEDLKATRASLRKLSLAATQSSDSIMITNVETEIEYVNAAFTEISGYAAAEVIGKKPNLLKSPMTPAETHADMWRTLLAGHTWRGETTNRRKDGRDFIIRQTISPIRQSDGTITHYISIGEDVTEIKRIATELDQHHQHLEVRVAERTADLEAAETRLRLILESTADGIYGTDNDGRFTFVNPAACRMLGYTADQLIGQPSHAMIHYRHADGSPFPLEDCPLHVPLDAGQMAHSDDDVFWRADGQPLRVTMAGQPMYSDGKVVGTVVSFTDIGTRKAAEAAQVAARTEAERLARVKGEFLANMSHEIRTPLGAIIGLARIGKRENIGRKAHDTCSRILDAGEHLLAVVNDILDFSKIEAGKLSIEIRPMRLATLIDTALEMVEGRAAFKGLELAYRPAANLPAWVLGDALRIRQILTNLLSNAIKFSERGQITLTVIRGEDDIWISVADEGIGMPREQLDRIFRPFEQADSSTTRNYGGTGLGLTISMNLASLMGGDISVSSLPGHGSTFTLHLQLPETAPPCTEDLDAPGAERSRRLAGLRILAAEDIEVNRLILADLLEVEGAKCIVAENGLQAVQQIEGHPDGFDAVLMDVQMPVMDGYEATRRINSLAPDLPVIGLSAHALAAERDKALDAGMVAYVSKPIDTDELVATILHCAKRPHASAAASASTSASAGVDTPDAVPPAPTFPAAALIDWQLLDKRFKGKQDFIRKLAQSALDTHAGAPDEVRQIAARKSFADLKFVAHNLKGLSGNLAAPAVQTLATQTDQAARVEDPQAFSLALELADASQCFLNELKAHLGQGDTR